MEDGNRRPRRRPGRNLLGESARENAYIVTVPGRGYRLATVVERKVGIAMKSACERCAERVHPEGAAYICSFECTFCESCFATLNGICPNCGGELQLRPRRA